MHFHSQSAKNAITSRCCDFSLVTAKTAGLSMKTTEGNHFFDVKNRTIPCFCQRHANCLPRYIITRQIFFSDAIAVIGFLLSRGQQQASGVCMRVFPRKFSSRIAGVQYRHVIQPIKQNRKRNN